MRSVECAVVGGGIIGLATALRLAEAGRNVVVIDAGSATPIASAGNAATIASYNCVPVGTPAVLRNLPRLLLHRDSPFAMRWAGLPALTPWLIRFVAQSLPRPARANAAALSMLLRDAAGTWRDLAHAAGAADLLRANGSLYLYPTQAALAATGWERAQRAAAGVREVALSPAEIAKLEPALAGLGAHGVLFPDALHIADPSVMLDRLRHANQARGTQFQRGRVTALRIDPGGIRLEGPELSVNAEHVVIAAGAWSRPLALQAGNHIPLDTERGYHIEYEMAEPPLSRPVAPIRFGVYLTPLAGRLRAAGTVELGGLKRPPDMGRLALLDRAARSVLPGLPRPGALWLGFRPSLPDSLPVIGRSKLSDRIILAFGHGHLGLTLAAVTARIIADLFAGAATPDAVSPRRFGN
jgi:D-amino-acid dehydrogenase